MATHRISFGTATKTDVNKVTALQKKTIAANQNAATQQSVRTNNQAVPATAAVAVAPTVAPTAAVAVAPTVAPTAAVAVAPTVAAPGVSIAMISNPLSQDTDASHSSASQQVIVPLTSQRPKQAATKSKVRSIENAEETTTITTTTTSPSNQDLLAIASQVPFRKLNISMDTWVPAGSIVVVKANIDEGIDREILAIVISSEIQRRSKSFTLELLGQPHEYKDFSLNSLYLYKND